MICMVYLIYTIYKIYYYIYFAYNYLLLYYYYDDYLILYDYNGLHCVLKEKHKNNKQVNNEKNGSIIMVMQENVQRETIALKFRMVW